MRYHILATDYDGTLARDGKVSKKMIEKLYQLKATGRLLVLVTGREMQYLIPDFPEYKVFDYIIAENGGLIWQPSTGREILLGDPPSQALVDQLRLRGVQPLSVGKVVIATWEPHEQTVLQAIRELGLERQVIFNKAAVMILPSGINKATGLKSLLKTLNYSPHNMIAVGDAENDGAMLEQAECAVAVSNALPAIKAIADFTTTGDHEDGVAEVVDYLLKDDFKHLHPKVEKRFLELGYNRDQSVFSLNPYRSGILLSGVSGGGKTTFTLSIVESLISRCYQFCLIDPEGDYLEIEGAVVIGSEKSIPPLDEIIKLLRTPEQNIILCILSVPLEERPAFFAKFLLAYSKLTIELGHPHWLLLDEAHHLAPAFNGPDLYPLHEDFRNFILITTSPDRLNKQVLQKTGMVMAIGSNSHYPFEQFCHVMGRKTPEIPVLEEGELCVWDAENNGPVVSIRYFLPKKLLQRHKKKYATGDMGKNSFVFRGPDNTLNLTASNLILFRQMALGIDNKTWLFHLRNGHFTKWFKEKIHDEELASISENVMHQDIETSKKLIVDYIKENYTT